ncbi:putative nuclear protein involved in pre-rRNA processing [Diplocarpon rosae]|nr:putative nuclear protein involved in pre-rRNA processing [Diplocarpon rosae]
MSPKRKYQELEAAEVIHPSRQFLVPGSIPKPAKKPRKYEPPVYRKQVHASSVNAIKKRIRDVSRKLERTDNASAEKKLEDERALTAYKQELADAEAEKTRQKMITKYHMVRFFERKKASRQLKKLRKQLLTAGSTEEVESLKAQMHIVEVDLNYTQYHPLSETYVSLYPTADSQEKEGESMKVGKMLKPPVWAEVERAMEEGTLDRLRNRKSNAPVQFTKPGKPVDRKPTKAKPEATPVDTTGLNRRERRKALGVQGSRRKSKPDPTKKQDTESSHADGLDADQDDRSDGGFFEL